MKRAEIEEWLAVEKTKVWEDPDFRPFLEQTRGLEEKDLEAMDVVSAAKNLQGIEISTDKKALAFPLFSLGERLLGWVVREIDDKEYRVFSTPLLQNLGYFYGLPNQIEQIKKRRQVILVEGVFDYIMAKRSGYPVLAVCTNVVSRKQKDILRLVVDGVFCMFDNDEQGRLGFHVLTKRKECFDVRRIMFKGKDPADFFLRVKNAGKIVDMSMKMSLTNLNP